MKKIYFLLLAIMVMVTPKAMAQSDMLITGVVDGDLPGGKPKAIEFYVINDIADLSVYGVGSANNGGGSDGVEFVFPADAASAGDFIYLRSADAGDDVSFLDYFGFAADYESSAAGINGDDAVELFLNDVVVDVFGDINVNGDGTDWDYTDSWAYRQNGTGPSTTFNSANWVAPGLGTLNDATTNAGAANPFPVGTYSTEGGGSAGEVTIQEIQETTDPTGDSPLVNQEVTTTGIVTAVYDEGFWIQDGNGAWSGVFVREDNSGVALGDEVSVTGIVQEHFNRTRINNLSDLTTLTVANALPSPEILTTGSVGVEEYESVLVQLLAVTCSDENIGNGEWLVNDGTGEYIVDDLLYEANPQLLSGYDLTGIAFYSFDEFKLYPRDAADVVVNNDATQLGLGFEASEISVNETSGIVTIEVQIFNATDSETSVNVATIGGTAVNGIHFNFTNPTTLTFPANDDSPQTFEVEILDDFDANDDREIGFVLVDETNGAVLFNELLLLTIQDDDTETEITDIEIVSEENAQGVAINNGEEFTVAGLVYGVNMNSAGLSFTIIDQTGGIGVYSNDVIDGYSVNEGDSVVVTGTVNQFNGLTQLAPTSIQLISQGNDIGEPTVVTELSNSTESEFIKLECVSIVNATEWTNAGSGFTVTITDGTNEFAMRIDNDVDLYSAPAPEGTFDVTGIGGQFTFNPQDDNGYQILPRSSADIVSQNCAILTNNECLSSANINSLLGGPVGEAQVSDQFTNIEATVGENDLTVGYECFGEPDGTGSSPSIENNVWFTFVGDGNTYFLETTDCNGTAENYIPDGNTQIAVYTGFCGDFQTPFLCNEDAPDSTPDDLAAGLEIPTEPGLNYFIMVDGYNGAEGDFCISMTRLPNANDQCTGAIDISDLTGGALDEAQTSMTFSNIGATSVNDPNPNDGGNDCWFDEPVLNSTVWFTFEGDGNEYFIETTNCAGVSDYIDDGDTQMAIYTGECDDLTQVACNEDISGENLEAGVSIITEAGSIYRVMVDGYDGADGEFCLQMTMTDFLSTSDRSAFDFSAYPNPTNGMVTIESPVSLENVTLVNVLGQRVKEWNITSAERFEFNTSDVEPGVYLIQAMSEGKVSTLKLIVE